MILSHVQFSEHSRVMHQVHAGFLLLGALCRAAQRIPEYSLFTVLSGGAFVFSSECPIRWAEDVDVNPAGYVLAVLAFGALLWTWVLHLVAGVAAAAAGTASGHHCAGKRAPTAGEAPDDV